MKYIIAYLGCLYYTASALGALYIVMAFVSGEGLLPVYLLYLCLISAIAGPVKVLISK